MVRAARRRTRRSTSTWPGRRWRRAVRGTARRRGRRLAQRLLPPHSHQRRLVPRSRPDLRAARPRRRGASRRSSTGATTPGAASIRRSTSTTWCPTRIGARARPAGVPPGHRPRRRLDRRERRGHAAHHRGLPAQPESQSARSTAAEIEDVPARLPRRAQDPLAGRRHRRRRHRRPRRRPDPLRRPERPWSRWSRTTRRDENYEPLQENLERLRGMTDQDGRPLRVVTAADAAAAVPRRPAAAGELRQLLHRQRRRAAPDLRPGARRRRARRRCRRCSPTGRSSASTAPTWSGAWARSTASPSSGRPELGLLPGPHERGAAATAAVHTDTRHAAARPRVRLTDVPRIGGLAGAPRGIRREDQRVALELPPCPSCPPNRATAATAASARRLRLTRGSS